MNVKRGGSRQSLSQTDQKPLKIKDPEHLYIPGMPVTSPAPHPYCTTLGRSATLWPEDLTQFFHRQSWRNTGSVLSGMGGWAGDIGNSRGHWLRELREADFLGSLEKHSSLAISTVQPQMGCPRRE